MKNLRVQIKAKIAAKAPPKPSVPHHSGKGTKARINTAAEKAFFQPQGRIN